MSAPALTAPMSAPICDAAYRGDPATVRRLLDRGSSVEGPCGDGITPLMEALQPYIGLPRLEPSRREQRTGSRRGSEKIKIASLMLERGANVRAADRFGMTALHRAAGAYGDERLMLPIVRELLRRGAPVDAPTDSGVTPLQLAVWGKRFETASELVSAGASLDLSDRQGRTASKMLVEQGRSDVLKRLRALGARK